MTEARVQRYVHERYRADSDTHRMASFVVASAWLTAGFSLFYALVSAIIGFWPGVVITGVDAALFVAIPLLVRLGVGLLPVTHFYVTLSFVSSAGCAYFSGGFASPVMPWVPATVLVALLVGGKRVGTVWAALLFVTTVAMGALWAAGVEAPLAYDLRFRVPFALACYGGLVLILYALGLEFEQGRRWAMDRLSVRNAELAAAMDDLREAEAQLVQEEKMASLGRLTAGVAHEMKNPLNFVTNFADLNEEIVDELEAELTARSGALDGIGDLIEDLRTNSRAIGEHGRRADGIVRSMTEHASLSRGARRPANLNRLVEDAARTACRDHERLERVPPVTLDLDLDPEAGTVEAVPERLGRAVYCLVTNALYAAWQGAEGRPPDHAPAATVRTRRRPGGVEVVVEDNGPGVPDADRARVFEPFFTTKPPGEGVGLGLSLSYDVVVHGHGGRLEARGADGGGAAFAVWLPDAPPAEAPAQPHAAESYSAQPASGATSSV